VGRRWPRHGERDRLGLFAEWEARWTPQWLSLVGIRSERVETDTGPVVGYNTSTTPLSMGFMKNMYEASSVGTRADFNAMDRSRTDHNLDLSAIARYTPDANLTFEFGLAQQTRSPNLYERYAWSRNVMALRAQYGVSAPPPAKTLQNWVDATGGWASLTPATIAQVRAVRVGVVTRSPQREKPDEDGNCTATTALPQLFGAAITPDVTDWQCYRFRTAMVVIPMRNIVMGIP